MESGKVFSKFKTRIKHLNIWSLIKRVNYSLFPAKQGRVEACRKIIIEAHLGDRLVIIELTPLSGG